MSTRATLGKPGTRPATGQSVVRSDRYPFTGFRPEEMSCALPAAELACLVRLIEETAASDSVVAKFAAEDARRFAVS